MGYERVRSVKFYPLVLPGRRAARKTASFEISIDWGGLDVDYRRYGDRPQSRLQFWKRHRRIVRSPGRHQGDPAAEVTLLKFFISTLQVRASSIGLRVQDDPQKRTIAESVANLAEAINLDTFATYNDAWNAVYKFERMLSLAQPTHTLLGEIQRRIDEASEDKVPTAPRLQKNFDTIMKDAFEKDSSSSSSGPSVAGTFTPQGEANLRELLQDILEEYHYFQQRKFCISPIRRNACNRIVIAEIGAFVLMIAPYVYLYAVILWTRKTPPFELWAWLPLYSAMTAGLFGAFFSRLQTLQGNWDNLSLGQVRDAMDWRSIWLRGTVGMGGALIVYFFLQSGLVGGELFPHFDLIGVEQIWYPKDSNPNSNIHRFHLIQPSLGLALLVVWSFVAGFSERIVPGILAATETSLGKAASDQRK